MNVNGFVRSRMRESRTYGSERGGYRKVPVYSIAEVYEMKKTIDELLQCSYWIIDIYCHKCLKTVLVNTLQ